MNTANHISEAERYIKIRYKVDDNTAKTTLKKCMDEVHEEYGYDEHAIYMSLSQLTSLRAKLEQPIIYDKLLICNNEMEFERRPNMWLTDRRGFITIDTPSGSDIRGLFGSSEVSEKLGNHKFKYIVTGECPYYIYMTHDGEPFNRDKNGPFIDAVKRHLKPKGYWVIYSYSRLTTKGKRTDEFRDNFINQIQAYGFKSVDTNHAPFIKKNAKPIVLQLI